MKCNKKCNCKDCEFLEKNVTLIVEKNYIRTVLQGAVACNNGLRYATNEIKLKNGQDLEEEYGFGNVLLS